MECREAGGQRRCSGRSLGRLVSLGWDTGATGAVAPGQRHAPHLKVRKTGTAEADVQLGRGGRTNGQGQARKYPYLPWKKFPQEAQLSHASWNVQAGHQAWKRWGRGPSLLASPVFQSVMG